MGHPGVRWRRHRWLRQPDDDQEHQPLRLAHHRLGWTGDPDFLDPVVVEGGAAWAANGQNIFFYSSQYPDSADTYVLQYNLASQGGVGVGGRRGGSCCGAGSVTQPAVLANRTRIAYTYTTDAPRVYVSSFPNFGSVTFATQAQDEQLAFAQNNRPRGVHERRQWHGTTVHGPGQRQPAHTADHRLPARLAAAALTVVSDRAALARAVSWATCCRLLNRPPCCPRPTTPAGAAAAASTSAATSRSKAACCRAPSARALTVPDAIARPPYADTGIVNRWAEPRVKSPEIIERMRHAGAVAAEVLRLAGEMVRPGITTDEIDGYVHELTIERNAYPSPLNYNGYPKSVCTCVNEVICHGIPDSRVLHDGDIVNIDVTCYIDGVHGDTNATFFVGDVDPESRQLVQVTEECMWHGIEAVVPGRPLSDIGRAIEDARQEAPLRRGEGVHRPRHRRAVPHRRPGPALLRPAGHHDHAARA